MCGALWSDFRNSIASKNHFCGKVLTLNPLLVILVMKIYILSSLPTDDSHGQSDIHMSTRLGLTDSDFFHMTSPRALMVFIIYFLLIGAFFCFSCLADQPVSKELNDDLPTTICEVP